MRTLLMLAACAALAAVLGGCYELEPAACDTEERAAQRRLVGDLDTAVRDSIAQVFKEKNRVERVFLEQAGCHFRATVYLDDFASRAYARAQAEAFVRVLKEEAPAETRPLETGIGTGLYDYVVTVHRNTDDDNRRPLVRAVKHYDLDRLVWN